MWDGFKEVVKTFLITIILSTLLIVIPNLLIVFGIIITVQVIRLVLVGASVLSVVGGAVFIYQRMSDEGVLKWILIAFNFGYVVCLEAFMHQ